MDKEFVRLRARARELRDRGIAQVREEYAKTLSQIAALERELVDGPTDHRMTISDCVETVMPRDQPFTVPEVVAALEGRYPTRFWRKPSVAWCIVRFGQRGLVRRLKRHTNTEPTIYVRAGVKLPPKPFEGMSLAQAIASILTKPMNETEIAVRLREDGFSTVQANGTFRAHILAELRKRFRKVGGRWERR
jgi:hypothetical protein